MKHYLMEYYSYFIGEIIIIIGIIGCNIFKHSYRLYDFFYSFVVAIGIISFGICLVVFGVNIWDYYDQKKLYESEYSCIVNFNEENKELMKTNRADVLKKAMEINENYFKIVDGEMRVKEYSFRYIKDDSWRGLKPINTNEISEGKCINKQ